MKNIENIRSLDIFLHDKKILQNLGVDILFCPPAEEIYPENWFDEKKGDNISDLNKHYAEFTGLYWIWKNTGWKGLPL